MLKRIKKTAIKYDMVLMIKTIEKEVVRDRDSKMKRVIMKIATVKREIIKDR